MIRCNNCMKLYGSDSDLREERIYDDRDSRYVETQYVCVECGTDEYLMNLNEEEDN